MDAGILAILATRTHGEAVDLPLGDECRVRPYPGLIDVEMLEGVLFLVLPLHVLLLVADRVPPDVEEPIRPGGAVDEERAEVEACAVLRDDEIDAFREAVTVAGTGDDIEMGGGEGVGDVEGIVSVDVAVGVSEEVVEDLGLEGVGWFHDERVQI